jgi:tRNA A37 methylthiotransferase MiaB
MKDIPKKDIVKEREKILKEIVKEKNFNFRKKHPDLEVLVEGKKGEYYSGFDQYYNKIFIQSERDLEKKWINILNYEVLDDKNVAKI